MATFNLVGSLGRTLGIVLGYFTITTSLLTAFAFSGIATGLLGAASTWLIGGLVLAEALVGVVYALFLHGLFELSGQSAVANAMLHVALPLLVPLFWIVCTARGELRWWHPLLWATYPLLYLGFALSRGSVHGHYPYPFLDVGTLGSSRVVANVAGMAVGFLLVAYGVVGLDHWLGRRRAGKLMPG